MFLSCDRTQFDGQYLALWAPLLVVRLALFLLYSVCSSLIRRQMVFHANDWCVCAHFSCCSQKQRDAALFSVRAASCITQIRSFAFLPLLDTFRCGLTIVYMPQTSVCN